MQISQYHDGTEVAKAVAELVFSGAQQAIKERGVFHWALAGGTTPKQCYELLRDADIDWSKVHIWFGDERCLAKGDVERNDVMADKALLEFVTIPEAQVHRMNAELGAEKAASLYEQALSQIPCLDLVLLGMGEDGHTASLFPANPALQDKRLVVPVYDSPKPPSDRVSMGYSALKSARRRVMMVVGEGKRTAFEQVCCEHALPIWIENSEWYIAF
ncbi:MAG: 6-phosphogluconolactonase [Mariprofundaceae bacterium]